MHLVSRSHGDLSIRDPASLAGTCSDQPVAPKVVARKNTRATGKSTITRAMTIRQLLALSSQLTPILRGARKEARMSQAALGARIGLSQKRISSLEISPGSMTVEQLLTITGVLGVEIMLQTRGTDMPKSEW